MLTLHQARLAETPKTHMLMTLNGMCEVMMNLTTNEMMNMHRWLNFFAFSFCGRYEHFWVVQQVVTGRAEIKSLRASVPCRSHAQSLPKPLQQGGQRKKQKHLLRGAPGRTVWTSGGIEGVPMLRPQCRLRPSAVEVRLLHSNPRSAALVAATRARGL